MAFRLTLRLVAVQTRRLRHRGWYKLYSNFCPLSDAILHSSSAHTVYEPKIPQATILKEHVLQVNLALIVNYTGGIHIYIHAQASIYGSVCFEQLQNTERYLETNLLAGNFSSYVLKCIQLSYIVTYCT